MKKFATLAAALSLLSLPALAASALDEDLRDRETGLPLSTSCGPDKAWILSIPSKGWQGPPTVKMVEAGVIRCRAAEARAEVPAEDKPLPFGWGGPLPPSTMHLWPSVAPVAPWPEE